MTARELSETLRAMSVWASNGSDREAAVMAHRLSTVDPFIRADYFDGYGGGEAFCAFCHFQDPHHGELCPLHALAPEPDAIERENEVTR
jgi:hypothetical protein